MATAQRRIIHLRPRHGFTIPLQFSSCMNGILLNHHHRQRHLIKGSHHHNHLPVASEQISRCSLSSSRRSAILNSSIFCRANRGVFSARRNVESTNSVLRCSSGVGVDSSSGGNPDTGSKNKNSASSSSSSSSGEKSSSSSSSTSDFFLDNLGKIFLGGIGAIILTLVRSSRGTNNRNALRDEIEELSALDPLEIDDLRIANDELTPQVMERIMRDATQTFPNGEATYRDFVGVVMTTMRRLHGENFTVQLGHLLDRVIVASMEEMAENRKRRTSTKKEGFVQAEHTAADAGADALLPLPFLFAALSLALNSSVQDRIRILFQSMQLGKEGKSTTEFEGSTTFDGTGGQVQDDDGTSSSSSHKKASKQDVIAMVGYLQQTCQLVPEAQIVEADVKYPVQQYRVGTPEELVHRALHPDKKKKKKDASSSLLLRSDGSDDESFDLQRFDALLRSRSVCAWGECYVKKKNPYS